MTNPYREHIAQVQHLVEETSRDHLATTAPDPALVGDAAYLSNFVVVSGGEAYDDDFQKRLKDLMKKVTDFDEPA